MGSDKRLLNAARHIPRVVTAIGRNLLQDAHNSTGETVGASLKSWWSPCGDTQARPHPWLATCEGDEVSKRIRRVGREGVESKRLRNVESRPFGCSDINEWSECSYCLLDMCPAERAFVAVIV